MGEKMEETQLNGYLKTLYDIFIVNERYMYIVNGLIYTLEITFFAAILGVVLGVILSFMSISNFKPFKNMGIKKLENFNPLSKLAFTYITIIRGTPTVVQLFIIFFVIFSDNFPVILAAIIAFGINSSAYVAEIIRAGIQGLDKGQMQAARALGLSYGQSMKFIIVPQAVKKIMPALVSEFIVLLKETSIVGMIGGMDLTQGAKLIQSDTYRPTEAWLSIALIYLLLTTIFTVFMHRIEKRLRKSD